MSRILSIITNPDPILRKKSESLSPAKINSSEMKRLCSDMKKTMLAKDGVGLAAPQVGKNWRIIVINTKNGPLCLLNPVIKKKSWLKEWGQEGCLSVPNVFGSVKRHKNITCLYIEPGGKQNTIKASNLLARVIQHEIDHLDGVLFIDKAKRLENNHNHD